MNLSRKTAVVGVYEHPTRFAPDKTVYQIMAESMRGALDDAGLTVKDVDGICRRRHRRRDGNDRALRLPEPDAQLRRFYHDRRMLVCRAHDARGGGDRGRTVRGRGGALWIADFVVALRDRHRRRRRWRRAPEQYDGPFGVTTVGAYAMVAQRHMHEYGTTPEQLAEVAVTMRLHASMNPAAKYRDLDHRRGCARVARDLLAAASARLLHHLRRRRRAGDHLGRARARSEEEAGLYPRRGGDRSSWRRGSSRLSGECRGANRQAAFERAGVKHSDIDMAMIYDSFTITVISQLENLGFCKRGEGGAFVSGGRLRFDGDFPINTDGGGLSSNHPGMRGIFLVIEATKQLRGECGPRQVKDCKLALAHGTGGALGTRHAGATLILTNQ